MFCGSFLNRQIKDLKKCTVLNNDSLRENDICTCTCIGDLSVKSPSLRSCHINDKYHTSRTLIPVCCLSGDTTTVIYRLFHGPAKTLLQSLRPGQGQGRKSTIVITITIDEYVFTYLGFDIPYNRFPLERVISQPFF